MAAAVFQQCGGDGECGTHGGGRQDQQSQAERRLQDEAGPEGRRQRQDHVEVQQDRQQDEGRKPDADLEQGIGGDPRPEPGHAPGQMAAQGEAEKEGGDDDGNRYAGRAKALADQPHPGDLIDQSREAREQQETSNQIRHAKHSSRSQIGRHLTVNRRSLATAFAAPVRESPCTAGLQSVQKQAIHILHNLWAASMALCGTGTQG